MTTTTGSVRSEIVAGSTADFMLVRHVSASGSQAEIGRVLAEEARSTYGWAPVPTGDPIHLPDGPSVLPMWREPNPSRGELR